MHKSKICLWYIVANEIEYLLPSLEIMSNYEWIDDIIVLHTINNDTRINYTNQNNCKIVEIWDRFGNGFEKSITDGGFDEVAARNKAILFADRMQDDWLIQCDADEFYTYNTIDAIREAETGGFDAINIDCLHPVSLSQAYFHPSNPRDAHRRIWRSNRGIKYNYTGEIIEKHNKGVPGYENKSIHCTPVGFKKLLEVQGDFHIHLHRLYGTKKPSWESIENWVKTGEIALKSFNSDLLPDIYKNIIKEEQKKCL